MPMISPDNLLRGPGSGAERPSEAAPQLRPLAADDQLCRTADAASGHSCMVLGSAEDSELTVVKPIAAR